jgi:hypothetical protein
MVIGSVMFHKVCDPIRTKYAEFPEALKKLDKSVYGGVSKEIEKVDNIGISFLSPCRGGIYDARRCGFDKSNPYMSAPKVRYVLLRAVKK